MFLKFLETTLLKKVCLASNRIVQMFRAGPNLQKKKWQLLYILHNTQNEQKVALQTLGFKRK